MKILFEDGSFLEIMTDDENETITIAMCGIKEHNKFTMSASMLNVTQVQQLIEFLSCWKENL